MNPTKITRPAFPKGYVDNPASVLTWDWVAAQLTESINYWLCPVRPPTPAAPAERPHVVPRWGVFIDGKIYYAGSPETRHAPNIESNPHVSLHLESGTEAMMLEGTSVPAEKPSPELGKKLSQAYKEKYTDFGDPPEPNAGTEADYSDSIPDSASHGQSSMKTRRSSFLKENNEMIVRMWHGRVSTSKAGAYREFLNTRAISDYQSVEGNLTVHILERKEGDITHFITLTFWKDMDSIKAFAGEDVDAAKYYSEDKDFLLEFEPRVVHYEVVGQS